MVGGEHGQHLQGARGQVQRRAVNPEGPALKIDNQQGHRIRPGRIQRPFQPILQESRDLEAGQTVDAVVPGRGHVAGPGDIGGQAEHGQNAGGVVGAIPSAPGPVGINGGEFPAQQGVPGQRQSGSVRGIQHQQVGRPLRQQSQGLATAAGPAPDHGIALQGGNDRGQLVLLPSHPENAPFRAGGGHRGDQPILPLTRRHRKTGA